MERIEGNSVTTAKVAERAGFSVGTVYRYFRDKRSLFRALAFREIERTERRVDEVLAENPDAKGEELIRILIDNLIRPFGSSVETQRRVNLLVIEDAEYRQVFAQKIFQLQAKIADKVRKHDPGGFRELPEEEVAVLLGTVVGPVWIMLRINPDRVHHPDFSKRLARTIVDFYRAEID